MKNQSPNFCHLLNRVTVRVQANEVERKQFEEQE